MVQVQVQVQAQGSEGIEVWYRYRHRYRYRLKALKALRLFESAFGSSGVRVRARVSGEVSR